LVEGDLATCLEAPYSVVVTKKMADKYFPEQSALGRHIIMNDSLEFVVTGVVGKVPEQSHIQFDMLVSFATYEQLNPDFAYDNGWGNYNVRNYILLDPKADPAAFTEKVATLYMDNVGDWMEGLGWKSFVRLEPLKEIYLHTKFGNGFGSVGSLERIWMVVAICIFVILLASVNFINLTTARSMNRAKETGLRKVVGSTRWVLMKQFLLESFITVLLAFVLAGLLVYELLPFFNRIMEKSYQFTSLFQPEMIGGILGLLIVVSLISGYYPAMVLSGFQPAQVLKGKMMNSRKGVKLRKSLVVFQFVISATLIIGTLAVRHQMQYMSKRDLGFNKQQVLVMNARTVPRNVIQKNARAILNDLNGMSYVQKASFTGALPGNPGWRGQVCFPEGMPDGQSVTVEYDPVDENYVDLLGLQILAGRNFDPNVQSDLDDGLLVNESAVKSMGWGSPENAIGKTIGSPSGHPAGTVIGVVKDYHQMGLRNQIGPIVLDHYTPANSFFAIHYNAGETAAMIRQMQEIWNSRLEEFEFQYFFLDESFEKQYEKEAQLAEVFGMFTGIAIFIAITGFFGLTTYLIISRQKEFGVRKVLGAGNNTIALMLSKEYLGLIVVANLIAIPISWWGISKWLERYAYSGGLNGTIFLEAFFGLIVFTLFVISFQTLRAGATNPASVLRNE
jgi:putative ABC transport system permease protein